MDSDVIRKSFSRLLGLLLFLIGGWLTIGGAWLASLGGSLYYLPAGLVTLSVALLVWRRRLLALWLYLGLALATLAWALAESGLDFWLLLPRLGMPLGLTILLLLVLWPGGRFLPGAGRSRAPWAGLAVVGAFAGVMAIAFVGEGESPGSPAPTRPLTLDAVADAEDATQWRAYGRTRAGTRYVPADQITPDNVDQLQVAWSYRTGDLPEAYPGARNAYSFQATPLKADDSLYLCSPRNIVIALDAETGQERWRHDPGINTSGIYMLACRGVSYHERANAEAACAKRILVATLDARLIALDAATGNRCPDFGEGGEISLLDGLGEVKPGYYLVSSPPAIVGEVAIVGGFVLDNMSVDEPPGVVRGYDVSSGRQLWAWDAGRPDAAGPWQPGEPYTRGSPNAWSVFSADEALGLVYIPTGNATPDYYGGQRTAAQDRYSSSVVALEASTGSVRWSFQTVHHDLWDYDVASQPVLIDLPVDGELVPALIQPTKHGEIFLLDRRSGEPVAAVEEQPVPRGSIPGERYSPTQPASVGMPSLTPPEMVEKDMWGATALDQLWCRIAFKQLRYEGKFTPPGLERTLSWPGNNGVMNWGSVSVDESRKLMAVSSSYMPLLVKLLPRDAAPPGEQISFDQRNVPISPQMGTPYAVSTERPFLSPLGVPCNAPPWGRLSLIDLNSRELLWQRPLGTTRDVAPLGIAMPGAFTQGGSIITRGGLVFIAGAQDDYLRAFDIETGVELWKGRLPAGGQATPMSFVSADNGKQYVVIAAGGHQYMQTTIGDYVIAFSLPD
ncbi:membrane-bound PQQ-dependent dehydrogenase, glucose/quinate/shikimate family [Pseudohalioglobus lutimaris]|uniref:Membrane-bound PQQ-dependent dehydrogenase, glucose/quinate/shikimate family n=1 Tax=Pseudohalioglobus lutimaris TaxID=1737061 RepID=A0A2N5X516_9GAMM|nr:membrane-bound PQQ-dependent dehydrogenase, glucose/quinate/shikimate family [Pseudohalioglobus lutimaris]PLW69580.1 membrane-bound PQQ-dependent dehydrogenase, glucose/quinate/shikimate family [Pseudohalioglobus lutimaris]